MFASKLSLLKKLESVAHTDREKNIGVETRRQGGRQRESQSNGLLSYSFVNQVCNQYGQDYFMDIKIITLTDKLPSGLIRYSCDKIYTNSLPSFKQRPLSLSHCAVAMPYTQIGDANNRRTKIPVI